MTFKGIDNQTVEIKITGYQYPKVLSGDWDGNWLNIYLKVDSRFGNWAAVDPALTTWELKKLINWFEALAKNEQPESPEMEFTEPNLSFELLDSIGSKEKRIRILFDLEFLPAFASQDQHYYVDCFLRKDELTLITEGLRTELNNFPERNHP